MFDSCCCAGRVWAVLGPIWGMLAAMAAMHGRFGQVVTSSNVRTKVCMGDRTKKVGGVVIQGLRRADIPLICATKRDATNFRKHFSHPQVAVPVLSVYRCAQGRSHGVYPRYA